MSGYRRKVVGLRDCYANIRAERQAESTAALADDRAHLVTRGPPGSWWLLYRSDDRRPWGLGGTAGLGNPLELLPLYRSPYDFARYKYTGWFYLVFVFIADRTAVFPSKITFPFSADITETFNIFRRNTIFLPRRICPYSLIRGLFSISNDHPVSFLIQIRKHNYLLKSSIYIMYRDT